MKVGDVVSWQRTFTEDDVRLFNKISGDEGVHHVTPDEQGRLMVHGLLTATLPTKIGGDMNFIARDLRFQFHRPVFAGDTVSCEVTLVALQPGDKYTNVRSEFVCRNQNGKEVMSGYALGVIRQAAPGQALFKSLKEQR
jgi:3-hydroxybutyryl-CoA dehydratase